MTLNTITLTINCGTVALNIYTWVMLWRVNKYNKITEENLRIMEENIRLMEEEFME